MSKVAPTIRAVLSAASLGLSLAAHAAGTEQPDADTVRPRFEVQATRLQAAPDRRSADGRFQLDARLQPGESRGQNGGELVLQAKLAGATAAACDNGGIFADGFEAPGPG
jgi:hypothetical protein